MPNFKSADTSTERKRIDSVTREAFTIFYAATQAIHLVAVPKLERFAHRVPNGWRDMKMIESRADKLTERLLDTLPTKQLDTMIAQMRVSQLRIVINEAGFRDDSRWIIDREDLVKLVEVVVENKCLMCDRNDWYNCEVRKIIGNLPVEIENVPLSCWRDGNDGK